MPRKKETEQALTSEQVALLGIQFNKNKDAIKALEADNKKIREPLEDYLVKNGTIPDEESGHRLCVVSHADVDVTLKHTHRVQPVLQPDAIDILKKNKITEAVETVEIVREDVIERLHLEGKISDELLQRLYATKTSDAFTVTVKSKFDEKGL